MHAFKIVFTRLIIVLVLLLGMEGAADAQVNDMPEWVSTREDFNEAEIVEDYYPGRFNFVLGAQGGYQSIQVTNGGEASFDGYGASMYLRYLSETRVSRNFFLDLGARYARSTHTETSIQKTPSGKEERTRSTIDPFQTTSVYLAPGLHFKPQTFPNWRLFWSLFYEYGLSGRYSVSQKGLDTGKSESADLKLQNMHRGGMNWMLTYNVVGQTSLTLQYSSYVGQFQYSYAGGSKRTMYTGLAWDLGVLYIF